MVMNRRGFLRASVIQTAFVGAGLSACAKHPGAVGVSSGKDPFQHGVASGDPLTDRVILWTRVSPEEDRLTQTVPTRWWIAHDQDGSDVVAAGETEATSDHDFTIKIDAEGLQPGSEYYFGFKARGFDSAVGRTRTLPVESVQQVRIAFTSCANYPSGFFNAYAAIATRDDIDVVLHLGDYIYEYGNGEYGDGTALGRIMEPAHEIINLEDYRRRHAHYKADPDLQAAHARHPWITVWDDHETADNSGRDGAANHDASEGQWQTRKLSAIRAYYEWMPIRELPTQLFRSFRFGTLADLVMLDTRLHGRDDPAPRGDHAAALDPSRSLLGKDQTKWLLDFLSESDSRGTRWRILGQQVVFSPWTDGIAGFNSDSWDGYRENRTQILDHLRGESIDNVVFLTGDVHSSWAYDVPPPLASGRAYDPETGEGSHAVEFVTPAVAAGDLLSSPRAMKMLDEIEARSPHLKYKDVAKKGFVILDLTPERARAEFVFVDTILERTAVTHDGPTLETLSGDNHLRRVES